MIKHFDLLFRYEVAAMWPYIKLVQGKPRHSQSQGSVERANRDVEDMLFTCLAENKSKDLVSGIKFVQMIKNRSHHSGIQRTPYKALFESEN